MIITYKKFSFSDFSSQFAQTFAKIRNHRKSLTMKLLIAFTFIALASFNVVKTDEAISERPRIPCVACTREYKPVCAEPTAGGDPITFDSRCMVLAQDCHQFEPRKSQILPDLNHSNYFFAFQNTKSFHKADVKIET